MLTNLLSALARSRRVPRKGFTQLTSKRGNKNFYKGKGVQPVGHHTNKGGYVILERKMPNYVVPDLAGFPLKAYVEHTASSAVPKSE